MKNFTISLLVLVSFNLGFSQLFVKDGSYMYVKNTHLFVKNEINLGGTAANVTADTDGKIYLRNEGQLLQGRTTSSANTGFGRISVFQEGTSDNFEYNYWSSPVGYSSSAVGNGNFDIGMLYRPTSNISSTQAATTGSYNGISVPLTIASYWIFAYRASANYSDWFQISNMPHTNANALKAGEGFTMKGTAGSDPVNPGEASVNNNTPVGAPPPGFVHQQRYDFRGKPNDGDIAIAVLPPAGATINSTLTGNPYPSAINLNYFLLENSGRTVNYTTGAVGPEVATNKVIDGAAYFWEQNKSVDSHNIQSYVGGYGSYVANGEFPVGTRNANVTGTYTVAAFSTYNLDGSVSAGAGSGSNYERMFSPIGQGFMINGDVAAAAVTKPALMKNAYRVFVKEGLLNRSEFEKQGSNNSTLTTNQNWDEIPNVAGVDYTQFSRLDVPQIKIRTILNNNITKEITMAFNSTTTDGFDTAMEAQSMDDLPIDVNFAFANDSKGYVTTTLPFAITKRIPVTLKSSGAGTFKMKVYNYINFDQTDNVYLYDNVSEVYHDIADNAYEFTLPEGTYSNRFEITFQNTALANPNNIKNNFVVVQNNSTQLLSISNPNSLDLKTVVLYDISGKQIFNKMNLGTKTVYEFPTQTLSEGVYLVKLQTKDNQTLTQKIVVSKR